MTCGVYSIRNDRTGERYVGASKEIDVRRSFHFWRLSKGEHHSTGLQRSYAEHGAGAFSFHVLRECREEELPDLEREYIELFKPAFNSRYSPPVPEAESEVTSPSDGLQGVIGSARARRGWSLLHLSRIAGVPYARLHEWINGTTDTISSRHVERLLAALDLKLVEATP